MRELNYAAYCRECKRMVAVTSGDLPQREVAKDVARWILEALDVQRVGDEAVRAADWGHKGCKHERKKK